MHFCASATIALNTCAVRVDSSCASITVFHRINVMFQNFDREYLQFAGICTEWCKARTFRKVSRENVESQSTNAEKVFTLQFAIYLCIDKT